MHYKIIEPVTLNGVPAGPDLPNYLAFEAGDIVELVPEDDDWHWAPNDGVSVVRLVDKEPHGLMAQELDTASLEAV